MNQPTQFQAKQRKLSAIMFSDIVGYSAMIGKDEQKGLQLREKNKEIHERLIKKNNGVLLKDIGDGLLCSFQSPYNAVTCAIEIQQSVNAVPELRLRIGIHVGDVIFQNEDVFGDGVNIAARVQSIANPDCICITERVFADIRNKPKIETRYIGVKKFKNIITPLKVYSVSYPGFTGSHPKKDIVTKLKSSKIHWIIPLIVLILLTIWYFLPSEKSNSEESAIVKLKPLTTTRIGIKSHATWSPDGSLLAYAIHNGENYDIVLSSKEGGNVIPLTDDPRDELLPRWSPDGTKIAYVADRGSGIGLFWRPVTGGAERKIAETNLHVVEHFTEFYHSVGAQPWSQDGNRILFTRLGESGNISLWESDLVTGNIQQVTYPKPGGIDLCGSWSFDGSRIVFERNRSLWLVTEEGKEIPLLEDEYINSQPTWSSDPNVVIFVSSRSGDFNLWQISISSGKLEQITFGEGNHAKPVVSKDGNLAFDFSTHTTDLFLLNLDNMETTQLTFYRGNNSYPRISPDGKKVIYQSDRTGNEEIWMLDLNSKEETQLTNDPASDREADWSPDGKEVVFLSDRTGDYELWIFNLESLRADRLTQQLLQLSNYNNFVTNVKWSPDGKAIGYLALDDKGRSIWIVDRNGENQRIDIEGVHSFDWYPGSNNIVYNRIAKSKSELRIRDIATGADTLLYNGPLTEIFVNTAGSEIGFIQGTSHQSQNIYALPLSNLLQEKPFPLVIGEPKRLTDSDGIWHAHYGTWAPKGDEIIYIRDEDFINIFLVENRKF
jgi:Tol biopolymer transport system component/class 3 adenylate cyclase